jgi:hypothetical protein
MPAESSFRMDLSLKRCLKRAGIRSKQLPFLSFCNFHYKATAIHKLYLTVKKKNAILIKTTFSTGSL